MIIGIAGLYGRNDLEGIRSNLYVNTEPPAAPVEEEPVLTVSEPEEGRYQEAAQILNNDEEEFRVLFYETLERRPCLYQNGTVTDQLDGEMLYRSRNSAGAVSSWRFHVSQGVTVLDDLWSFDKGKNEYCLLALEDTTHALTVGLCEADQVKWSNTITWR